MRSDYWNSALRNRISRRRVLAAAGSGAAAAFLAACGSSDSSSKDTTAAKEKSGLLAQPEDTTKKAVPGGVWQDSRTSDPATLDVVLNNSSLSWNEMLNVYSQLAKAGVRSNKAEAFEGDAASSWEISPDGMQVTFKLRPGIKFDPRPPTSSRVMTTADVKYSFDKFAQVSPYRGEVFHSVSPVAPVDSYSTPDDNTVVMKLAFPYAPIIEMVGFGYYLYIEPKEGATFDLRSQMRGSGPYQLTDYTPSIALEYTRNKDYYVKDRPFLDGIKRTIIPDYGTGLAQFESKALWSYVVRQEDILRLKKDHPEMVMHQLKNVGTTSLASTPYLAFSQRADSPLKDVRLRRAASMLIDREAWIDTFYNVEAFAKEGLPAETLWNSQLPTGSPNWIDPRQSEIGEGGQYFKFNPAEAKKLLAAAGQKTVNLPFYYHNQDPLVAPRMSVFASMLEDAGGFALGQKVLDYNSEWRSTCQQSAGEAYTGLCYNNSGGFNEDAYLVAKYTVGGKYAVSTKPIDGITDLVQKVRTETDPLKRAGLVKEVQKQAAIQMTDIPYPGLTYSFNLRWPWLKNYLVFVNGGTSSREFTEYWYDAAAKT